MHSGRDQRIDFFRGLALVFIFWDHIPQNILGLVTPRNLGFSDAAEIFVFLAGYASVLAYGKVIQRDGYLVGCLRVLRRAWVLYVAHIFLLAVLMGIVFTANEHIETRNISREMGLDYFLANPQQALIDELLLRFKPNLMDPLPLYIVLLLSLPLVLPLLLKRVGVAIGLSLLLYLLVQAFGWNFKGLPPDGKWYFNPLAWQLVFVLGGAAAVLAQRGPVATPARRRRGALFFVSMAYLAACLVVALGWKWQALHNALVADRVAQLIYPISKTDLSPVRLLHFLALAYCVPLLIPRGAWLQSWPAQQLRRMGRYSLEVFCLGVLLAPLADFSNARNGDTLVASLSSAVLGVALMALLAAWLDFNQRLNSARQARAAQPPLAVAPG
jgi:hypothetical protein